MKKLFAILLAVTMLFTLTACKSEEQKAADEYLEKVEKLMDRITDATEDQDIEALMSLSEELMELAEEYDEIYEALEEVDEEAAEEFEEALNDLAESMPDF